MSVLHMETETVRGVGNQMQQASGSFQQQTQQINHSVQMLVGTWQGSSADIFLSEIQPLLNQLNQFSSDGAVLGQRLQQEVGQWEQVGGSFGLAIVSSDLKISPDFIDSTVDWGQVVSGDGSHFWQTWRQAGVPTDLFTSTNYHLLRGAEIEMKSRYLAGEMRWDEMIQNLKGMEKSLKPGYLDTDFTLYKIAEGQTEGGAVVWRNDWAGENWIASLRTVSGEGQGNYAFEFSEKGLEGKLQGEAGLYAMRGTYNAQVAGVDAAVDGYVGVQTKGEFGGTFNPGIAMVATGGSAFAGARIDGSVSKDVEAGGVKVTGEGRGGVSYGVGIKGEVDLGYDHGVVKADVDFGVTVGLGAELGFSVELDVTGAVDNVVNTGLDLVDFGTNGIKSFW